MTLLSTSDIPKTRRRFTAEFKARIVADCLQPNASVAGIALQHDLNANLVHKWIRAARLQQSEPVPPAFLPVPLQAPSALRSSMDIGDRIRIEIPHANGSLVVNWPLADGDRCLRWLQDWLR